MITVIMASLEVAVIVSMTVSTCTGSARRITVRARYQAAVIACIAMAVRTTRRAMGCVDNSIYSTAVMTGSRTVRRISYARVVLHIMDGKV